MAYDGFSKWHPATNFVFFAVTLGLSVVILHPLYVFSGCLAGAAYYVLLRGRKALALIGGLIPLYLLIAAVNPLFNTLGNTPLIYVFGRPYTWEALCNGMVVAGVFVNMLLWFGCYSVVLTSDKFVCLFGGLIPSISMLLVMILRMIPNLLRRGGQILEVRRSIGKGPGKGSSQKGKLEAAINMLSSLTDWSLEGGIVTADSMRSRGYGTGKRTSFRMYRFQMRDLGLLAVMTVLGTAVILLGGTGAVFVPELQIDRPTMGLAAYVLFISIPLIIHGKEAVVWHSSLSRI